MAHYALRIGFDLNVPTAFASGSVVGGSYNAGTFVWTPEKNASGVVYQASWDEVPTSTWVTVTNTEMTTLTAEITAASLGWNSGNLGWASYTQSWSGWAIDQTWARVWHTCSGGHSDGNLNGVYRFDCYKMAWAVEQMPTSKTLQDAEYAVLSPDASRGGIGTTNYAAQADSLTQYGLSTLAHINDSWYDEFLTDNQPTARHTYHGVVYDSARNKIYMAVRRWWEFDRAAGTWNYRRVFNDAAFVPTGSGNGYAFTPAMDASGQIGIWDEVVGEMLFSSSEGIEDSSYKYNPSTATFGAWAAPWNGLAEETVCRNGRFAVVLEPPAATGTQVGRYFKYDLDARSTSGVQGDLQFSGCSRADFGAALSPHMDGGASTYIPSLGKYLMCCKKSDSTMGFYWIDPTTSPSWEMSPATMTNAPTGLGTLMNGRMVYMESLSAILLQDQADEKVYIFKY
mgnify:CR=1 FL=1